MTLIQGALIDRHGTATSCITPATCFLIVAAYGWFDLTR
jgi:FHS family L-fucose permease-like MFS transporter